MPRYKLEIEFDHPGDGYVLPSGDLTCAPDKWRWNAKKLLDNDDSKIISLRVYEKDGWALIRSE